MPDHRAPPTASAATGGPFRRSPHPGVVGVEQRQGANPTLTLTHPYPTPNRVCSSVWSSASAAACVRATGLGRSAGQRAHEARGGCQRGAGQPAGAGRSEAGPADGAAGTGCGRAADILHGRRAWAGPPAPQLTASGVAS
eukprot:scaffold6449_cov43-Phaeocystis_antarctica.AAC.4